MLYQGIIGGGSSPVEDLSPVLLWTNSNPGATFAAQTVSLDLTEYAGVLIESITNGIGSTTYVKKTEKGACGTIGSETGGGAARVANVSETNVVFSDAYALDTVTNTAARPTKIYGVKKYVVDSNLGGLIIEGVSDIKIIPFTTSNESQTVQLNGDFDFVAPVDYPGIDCARSKTRQWTGTAGLGANSSYGFTAFDGTSFTFLWDASISINIVAIKFKNSISDNELLNTIKNNVILNALVHVEDLK